MMDFTPRIGAALALAAAALFLTGCQGSAPKIDRALNVTALPPSSTHAPAKTPAPTAGLDLHFGSSTFGINCATDSAGDNAGGIAALSCSWNTGNH